MILKNSLKRLIFSNFALRRELSTSYPLLSILTDIENRSNGESFSSLYISGRYGAKLYPTAIPHVDLNYFASNLEPIYQNWKRRDPTIQLDEAFKSKILQLADISSSLEKLIAERKLEADNEENPKNLELPKRLKLLSEEKWNLEEEVIPVLLNVPNTVYFKATEGKILGVYGQKPNLVNPKNCVELGFLNNHLEFTNASPNGFYLIGTLAEMELELIQYFTDSLKIDGLNMVSLPNFVKSAIIEGAGKSPFNSNKSICVKEKSSKWGNLLHLSGSASVEAYLSYLTRMRLNSEELPIVLFNIGRKYSVENVFETCRLLKPFQSSEIFTFAIDANEDQSIETFEKLCALTSRKYESLKLPYRVKECPATALKNIESLKIQFEVWSPFLNSYVACGYIALYGNYLSKRVMTIHEKGFQSHVGGCIVNVTTLLACMMEIYQNCNGEIIFPMEFKRLK